MSTPFGEVLSNAPFVSPNVTDLPTDAILRNRFTFFSTVLCNYVKYSQEVESKSKAEVLQRINPIISRLVEKYSFGSKFVSDINRFVNDRFHQTSFELYADMRNQSGLSTDEFDTMMMDMKDSKLIDEFSINFKMMLR